MVRTFPMPDRLRELAEAPMLPLFRTLDSTPKGLTEAEAAARAERFGANETPPPAGPNRLTEAVGSPFVALLSVLCLTFLVVGNARAATTVAIIVALSVILRSWQSTRAERAVRALRRQVTTTATVRRRAADGHQAFDREVPVEDLVPGDIVVLAAGDIVPADVRLLTADDLLVDQSALTGETQPVRPARLCFAGTAVVGGEATSVVVAIGTDTYFRSAARGERSESSFDVGVRAVGWTLVRFMLVLAPIVLAVNGTITGDWAQAAMFALAVAVGLTPEMLPVIVTTNLVRGAVRLARHNVIVKRLNAVQDLAGLDVLCVRSERAGVDAVRELGVAVRIATGDAEAEVRALREAGHVVGFLGDGVHDAPALRVADVGIATSTATDVAQEAADLLLTDRDLAVVAQGVGIGRHTLGNTMKYVKITASSNLGNVFTVVVASAFLPFLPMLPIQLVALNLLYDSAQLAVPWDRVDRDYLKRPRRWDARDLARFMLVFGPISSLFDLAMFAALWWALDLGGRPELFQTGWFVESLLSQLLVVLVLRGRERPSRQVLLATAAVAALALTLPLTGWLQLQALPGSYFLWLAGVLAAYAITAHLVKALFLRAK
jgi:magnesium-transporting ATPase (P-type)